MNIDELETTKKSLKACLDEIINLKGPNYSKKSTIIIGNDHYNKYEVPVVMKEPAIKLAIKINVKEK